jgi:hypothetical protein
MSGLLDVRTCRHCGWPIEWLGVMWGHVHGPGHYLNRCRPEDSGKPYGLEAEPCD